MRPVVIAHVSDLHAGSSVGMCPPYIRLDDGDAHLPSKLQSWYWQCWQDFWQVVKQRVKAQKADLYLVLNGDLVEGHHHSLTHLVARNPNAQAHIFDAAIKIPLALKPSKIWVIRGTEAHGGTEDSSTERIAVGLHKDKRPVVQCDDTGTYSHWHAFLRFPNRTARGFTRIDIAHHGRTGQREHTRGGAAVLHAHDILLSHVKANDPDHPYPDLCLRGHYHKFNDSGESCPVRVVTSGAWMGHTGHTHKVVTDSIADCGGHIISVLDNGYMVEKVAFPVSRGSVWHA